MKLFSLRFSETITSNVSNRVVSKPLTISSMLRVTLLNNSNRIPSSGLQPSIHCTYQESHSMYKHLNHPIKLTSKNILPRSSTMVSNTSKKMDTPLTILTTCGFPLANTLVTLWKFAISKLMPRISNS